MDRDAYILHCWSGPGDLQRLRQSDWSFWEEQHREALEFEAKCKAIALGQDEVLANFSLPPERGET